LIVSAVKICKQCLQTASASEAPDPLQGVRPWTPLGTSVSQTLGLHPKWKFLAPSLSAQGFLGHKGLWSKFPKIYQKCHIAQNFKRLAWFSTVSHLNFKNVPIDTVNYICKQLMSEVYLLPIVHLRRVGCSCGLPQLFCQISLKHETLLPRFSRSIYDRLKSSVKSRHLLEGNPPKCSPPSFIEVVSWKTPPDVWYYFILQEQPWHCKNVERNKYTAYANRKKFFSLM